MKFTLKEITNFIGGALVGDASKEILGINTLTNATSDQISFATSSKYKESLLSTDAGAVIVNKNLKEYCSTNILLVEDVHLAYSILSHKFNNPLTIIVHDSFNPECRKGIKSIDYKHFKNIKHNFYK